MNIKRYSWWILNIVWIGLVILLSWGNFQSEGGLRSPAELLARVELESESIWMGIYLNDKKIGYINTEIEPFGDGGYIIREFSRMTVGMMGVDQDMKMRMEVITDSTLALVSFDGNLEAKPYNTIFKGQIKDKVLSVQVTAGGQTSERFIPAPEPLYTSQSIKPIMKAGRLGPGDSLRLSGFDPISLEMKELVVIYDEQMVFPTPTQPEGEYIFHKLITRMSGFESQILLNDKFEVLKENGPMGIMMRPEPMEKALKIYRNDGTVDFLSMYAIQPTGRIALPRQAKRVRYRIEGIEDLNQLTQSSDRQTLIDSMTIEVATEFPPTQGINTKAGLQQYVNDAPFIESQNKLIKLAAKKAVRDCSSLSDTLNRLSNWVFRNVEKYPSAGIPSALAVLSTRQGDCNEHSVLFTAMARSLGIPTRIQLGVVYQEDQFYYHAWVASWLDGKWQEYDPTFGQIQADAARIAFASGDMTDAASMVNFIGKIKIEIIESQ